jgi:hypothetical protein
MLTNLLLWGIVILFGALWMMRRSSRKRARR